MSVGLTRSQRRHRGLTESAVRRPGDAGPLRFAFADPPYPGQAHRHYGQHDDFGGEVDHAELVGRLMTDYPDGWALCSGARMIPEIVPLMPEGIRVLAWTNPASNMKPGVSVDFGWEPVYLWGGRRRHRSAPPVRDWISVAPEQWTFRDGAPAGAVIGMKPRAFCHWIFNCLGARADDELHDLFPGSGAVGRAWNAYTGQADLFAEPYEQETFSEGAR